MLYLTLKYCVITKGLFLSEKKCHVRKPMECKFTQLCVRISCEIQPKKKFKTIEFKFRI